MIVLQNDQNVVSRSFASQQQCQIVAERNNAEIKSMNDKITRDHSACGDPVIFKNSSGYIQMFWPKETEQCRVNAIKNNTIPKTKNYYCIAG